MPANLTSKSHILDRIRKANGSASATAAATTAWASIPRAYKRTGQLSPEATLLLLEDRLRDYDATVTRTSLENLSTAIAAALNHRHKQHVLIAPGTPTSWLPDGFTFTLDESLTAPQLDAFDTVLTGATLAIAETGTVVLQNIPGQGRRAISLVPDYHLCIVRSVDIVETVPEAFARLQSTAHLATTFVSGPSATADIEMTRIKGVHGPRILDVLLLV
jgi:L-lactate dehydrogenase complex protein LldG